MNHLAEDIINYLWTLHVCVENAGGITDWHRDQQEGVAYVLARVCTGQEQDAIMEAVSEMLATETDQQKRHFLLACMNGQHWNMDGWPCDRQSELDVNLAEMVSNMIGNLLGSPRGTSGLENCDEILNRLLERFVDVYTRKEQHAMTEQALIQLDHAGGGATMEPFSRAVLFAFIHGDFLLDEDWLLNAIHHPGQETEPSLERVQHNIKLLEEMSRR